MPPTAIAPTADLATPRVHKVAEKWVAYLAPAELVDFFLCCPATSNVESHQGDRWIEATWGVVIETDCLTLQFLADIQSICTTVSIDEVDIRAKDNKLILEFTVSARVMRH